MAAVSKNKYDAFEWLKKVIVSCTSLHQKVTINKLIDNFYKQYDASDDMFIEIISIRANHFRGLTWD